jgi:hypothetical protein
MLQYNDAGGGQASELPLGRNMGDSATITFLHDPFRFRIAYNWIDGWFSAVGIGLLADKDNLAVRIEGSVSVLDFCCTVYHLSSLTEEGEGDSTDSSSLSLLPR